MWLAAVRRRLHSGRRCCCAPDVGPHCVSLSFRGAGRGEPSRRGHRGAGARRVPLSSPQGRHRQGPRLEHCGDISQMLLPRARSPARRQWPSSRLSFPKGGLPRWVTPSAHQPPPLPHPCVTQLIFNCIPHVCCWDNESFLCIYLWKNEKWCLSRSLNLDLYRFFFHNFTAGDKFTASCKWYIFLNSFRNCCCISQLSKRLLYDFLDFLSVQTSMLFGSQNLAGEY